MIKEASVNNTMIYFVSGYMRTGTSMMMKALEAGGMDAAYNKNRDILNERCKLSPDDPYFVNEGGLYELYRKDYQQPGFPRGYDGKLIKFLFGGITRIVAGNYRIVFMRRNYEEVRQSCQNGLGVKIGIDEAEFTTRMEDTIGILNQRKDVALDVFWYRDVVDDPLTHFQLLQSKAWPINPQRSAEIVDPKLCRFRLENLEVGL